MRLIDADELDFYFCDSVFECSEAVEFAETIDAVPVTRCKDCKRWDKFVGEEHRGFCFAWKVDSYDEDFCSYGMRKENNND